MAMNLHELEEMEFEASRGDRLWSADPADCCGGMHQLGVCLKVEADIAEQEAEDDWNALTQAERDAITARVEADRAARRAKEAAALAANEVF